MCVSDPLPVQAPSGSRKQDGDIGQARDFQIFAVEIPHEPGGMWVIDQGRIVERRVESKAVHPAQALRNRGFGKDEVMTFQDLVERFIHALL